MVSSEQRRKQFIPKIETLFGMKTESRPQFEKQKSPICFNLQFISKPIARRDLHFEKYEEPSEMTEWGMKTLENVG
jgi:hypothetical protein